MNTSKCYRRNSTERLRDSYLSILSALLLAMVCIASPTGATATERLAVLPFEIVDNTPVPGGEERNSEMLDKLTRFIAKAIEAEGLYQVVPQAAVNEAVKAAALGTYIHSCNQCEYDLAKQLASDKVMVGWIYKMSILILTLHIEIKDVASQQTVISKAYDFRGDNEKAWLRAAEYMVRDLSQMIAH
jgi:hypothetical protein